MRGNIPFCIPPAKLVNGRITSVREKRTQQASASVMPRPQRDRSCPEDMVRNTRFGKNRPVFGLREIRTFQERSQFVVAEFA